MFQSDISVLYLIIFKKQVYTRLDGLSQYYVLFIKKDAQQIHQIIEVYRYYLLWRKSFVWISQGVGDVDVFMEIFKTKLQEHFKNTWFTDIGNTSKLAIYSTLKREFEPERYLNFKIIKSHRQALSRLRCSSHMLQIEVGRHKNMVMADRLCVFCK